MVQEEKIASFYYAQYRENAIHKGKNRAGTEIRAADWISAGSNAQCLAGN